MQQPAEVPFPEKIVINTKEDFWGSGEFRPEIGMVGCFAADRASDWDLFVVVSVFDDNKTLGIIHPHVFPWIKEGSIDDGTGEILKEEYLDVEKYNNYIKWDLRLRRGDKPKVGMNLDYRFGGDKMTDNFDSNDIKKYMMNCKCYSGQGYSGCGCGADRFNDQLICNKYLETREKKSERDPLYKVRYIEYDKLNRLVYVLFGPNPYTDSGIHLPLSLYNPSS